MIAQKSYEFVLTGTRSILFHRDSVEASDQVEAWRKDPANKKLMKNGDDRCPPWTWQTYMYVDDLTGIVGLPSENLMASLRGAGARMLDPNGKRGKSLKEASQSALWVPELHMPVTFGGKEVTQKWMDSIFDDSYMSQAKAVEEVTDGHARLYAKRVRVGQAKHVRVRWEAYPGWQVRGKVDVMDPDLISKEILQQLFEIAGRGGMGDWRPCGKTPGQYGQFKAEIL